MSKYRITPRRPGFKYESRYVRGDDVKLSQTINRMMSKYAGKRWTAPYTMEISVHNGRYYESFDTRDVRIDATPCRSRR